MIEHIQEDKQINKLPSAKIIKKQNSDYKNKHCSSLLKDQQYDLLTNSCANTQTDQMLKEEFTIET